MTSSIPVFTFDEPIEPQVLSVARSIAARIASGARIDRKSLNAIMNTVFGGSDAEGRWSVRDAHAALEFGQVLWLHDTPTLKLSSDPIVAEGLFVAREQCIFRFEAYGSRSLDCRGAIRHLADVQAASISA